MISEELWVWKKRIKSNLIADFSQWTPFVKKAKENILLEKMLWGHSQMTSPTYGGGRGPKSQKIGDVICEWPILETKISVF